MLTVINREFGFRVFVLLIFAWGGLGFQATGQDHTLVIKDIHGEAVPFLLAVEQKTSTSLVSDPLGQLVLPQGLFSDSDTITFTSMFYVPLRIAVYDLRRRNEVVLTPVVFTLNTVSVGPEEDALSLMKKVARNFGRQYLSYYVSRVTVLNTVECNGRYREFRGYQGLFGSWSFSQSPPDIYFNDRHKFYWAPLAIFRSDPLMAGSDDILEPRSVRNPSISGDISKLKAEYVNDDYSALIAKRALELYAPLRQTQVNNFTYTIHERYQSDEGEVVVIHFKTKPNAFPKKTRLYGQGYIHCLSEQAIPIRVITENMQDHYSFLPRRLSGILPSATRHKLDVVYGQAAGGIFTKSVSMWIDWVDPGTTGDEVYYITWQRRRDPVKNKLKEYKYLSFSDVIPLNPQNRELIRKNLQERMDLLPDAPALFDRDKWNIHMPGIDSERLFKELNVNGKTLYEQAKQNELRFPDSAGQADQGNSEWDRFYRSYYKLVRQKFFRDLYGVVYE